jgi:murein L,D-transpeptidase YcbB/YkuD
LFAKAKRNLSLGCVRVERPQDLAQWLFGHTPPVPGDDAEQNVRIDEGVPIYISYLTARPDGATIAFADDVYKLDAAPAEATGVVAATASADK